MHHHDDLSRDTVRVTKSSIVVGGRCPAAMHCDDRTEPCHGMRETDHVKRVASLEQRDCLGSAMTYL